VGALEVVVVLPLLAASGRVATGPVLEGFERGESLCSAGRSTPWLRHQAFEVGGGVGSESEVRRSPVLLLRVDAAGRPVRCRAPR
jgi:hypothetical protein